VFTLPSEFYGTHNLIEVDPKIFDISYPPNNNYTLQKDSICINNAIGNFYENSIPAIDIKGLSRKQLNPSIGAYEGKKISISDITQNIISALNSKNIEINGTVYAISCEQQRSVFNSQGEDVYIEVCGPWPETLESDSNEKLISLHYAIDCHINCLNDEPPESPITEQTKDVGDDLKTLLMASPTRGDNALVTRIEGEPYYYFSGSIEQPDFIVHIDCTVEVFTNIF
jgi:hypothetical protein